MLPLSKLSDLSSSPMLSQGAISTRGNTYFLAGGTGTGLGGPVIKVSFVTG
jgi:hypothetical protein